MTALVHRRAGRTGPRGPSTASSRRRLALAAVSVAVASLPVSPARAAGEVSANATSRVIAVAPVSGGLSLEVGLGSAVADLEGSTPRGESATLKPGIIGLLAGSTVPLPGPSKADLRAEKQVDRTSVVPPVDLGAVRLTTTRERAGVTAADDEAGLGAWARTDLSDVEIAGLVEVAGGTATASATAARAEGTASLGRITVVVGGVTVADLSGLEWRVSAELGGEPTASFSVGSAVIQGERQAIDSPEELRAALEPLAPLFAPVGLSIRVPQLDEREGGAALTPLVIESVNADLLRSTVGAVYPSIAPAYNDLATQLQDQAPEAGLALLVANVGLSIAAGNGGARVALGGVSATIAPRESFDGGTGAVASGTGVSSTGGIAGGIGAGGGSTPASSLAGVSPFYADTPAERTGGGVGPTVPARVPVAGGGEYVQELARAPIAAGGGSAAPAPLVFVLALAVAAGLAALDQLNVTRRAALRAARARSGAPI